jgi:hypothetical protein
VSLLGIQVGGTRAKVITKRVYLKLLATTTREGLLCNHWDLVAHDGGKECLPETSRPALISAMRPNVPQPAHQLKEEDTLGGIHFLGHKDSRFRV